MLKIKPFRQETGYCGPASLKMVLSFYGIEKSEHDLVKMTGCSKEWGVEAWQLLQTAEELGLQGFVKDFASIDDLKKHVLLRKTPVIVDWFSVDDGHYSVVVDIGEENIYLMDPEIGYVRAMRLEKFRRVWFDFPEEFIKDKDDLNIRRMIVLFKEPWSIKEEHASDE